MTDEATGGDSLIAPQPQESWYNEDNKELVTQKGWSSADDALRSYRELEKGYSGRVKMPTPESSAEEIRSFYQRTGCPENPEGYEIKTSEGADQFRNESVEKALSQIAYEQGVSKQAFEAIANRYYEKMTDDLSQSRESGERTLREELGEKYDESIKVAQRFAGGCSPEFMDLMDSTGLGNNAVVVKEFIRLGQATMADELIKGDGAEPKKDEYVPQYKDSPEMYATGEDGESAKAREYFTSRGHKY